MTCIYYWNRTGLFVRPQFLQPCFQYSLFCCTALVSTSGSNVNKKRVKGRSRCTNLCRFTWTYSDLLHLSVIVSSMYMYADGCMRPLWFHNHALWNVLALIAQIQRKSVLNVSSDYNTFIKRQIKRHNTRLHNFGIWFQTVLPMKFDFSVWNWTCIVQFCCF